MFAYSEDPVSQAVLLRILGSIGVDTSAWTIDTTYGAGAMRSRVPKYAEIARRYAVVLFTDLDTAPCPRGLIQTWMGSLVQPRLLHIRVAVREVESWVLADREGFAEFLDVSEDIVPRSPDGEIDPKTSLLLVAEKSRLRAIRKDMVVRRDGQPRPALSYNSTLTAFVGETWNIERASVRSPSLARTCRRLRQELAPASSGDEGIAS